MRLLSPDAAGVNYNFVSIEAFQGYIAADKMLEYGERNGTYYGTMKVGISEVRHKRVLCNAGVPFVHS